MGDCGFTVLCAFLSWSNKCQAAQVKKQKSATHKHDQGVMSDRGFACHRGLRLLNAISALHIEHLLLSVQPHRHKVDACTQHRHTGGTWSHKVVGNITCVADSSVQPHRHEVDACTQHRHTGGTWSHKCRWEHNTCGWFLCPATLPRGRRPHATLTHRVSMITQTWLKYVQPVFPATAWRGPGT